MKRHALYLALLPLLGFIGTTHAADWTTTPYTQSDSGGVGLLQMPTARFDRAGEFGFIANRVAPYTRYSFSLQPLPWLEAGFRYTDITNRPYGPVSLSGHQTYKDKAVDLKVRLWRESRWLPAVALGMRDIGGTGLFSGEYLVASKRWYNLDFSLGLGWGYVGARGDLPNPLGWIDNRFKTRPTQSSGTGTLSTNHYFRGRTSLFGGVAWQTPWSPLRLKLEYDGNNYRHEPKGDNQRQRSPFNVGAVYRLNRSVDLSVGYERGTTVMFGLTLHTNLADDQGPPKVQDPAPEARAPAPPKPPAQADWADISQRLHANAGIDVTRVARRGDEIVVTGEQDRYFYPAKGLGRAARILDNSLGPGIDWFTLASTREGMPVVDTSVNRSAFKALLHGDTDVRDLRRNVEMDAPIPQREQVLYRHEPSRYHGGFALGVQEILGGPDAFILYQLDAHYDAEYRLSRHWWTSTHVNLDLFDNYSNFHYDAPSNLPRVRTYAREYVTTSRLNLSNLQLTGAWRLAPDLYGMVYGGYLESMYAGGGGEVLWRPFGRRWALGADANYVRQRAFSQHFGLRHYHVATGHVTAYIDTGFDHVLAVVSAGRYLAGDWGTTINLSRTFANGVTMGAYATFTNVSRKQFGEGGFNKGIYISVPFDLILPHSSTGTADFVWQPLTRDGGAPLARRYGLYTLTNGRDPHLFYDNLDRIDQ